MRHNSIVILVGIPIVDRKSSIVVVVWKQKSTLVRNVNREKQQPVKNMTESDPNIQQDDRSKPRSLDSLLQLKPQPNTPRISFASICKLASSTKSNKSSKICLHLPIEELVNATTLQTRSNPNTTPNTQREALRDDGTIITSRMTTRSNYSLESSKSKSSFRLRVSMSGGVVVAGPMARVAITGLGLQQQELRFLKETFDEMDRDKDGRIDKLEFLKALGEADANNDYHSFTEKVYQRIQLNWNQDNGISFDEFIHMSGTFCMFTPSDIPRFVFRCYNKQGDGMFGTQDFIDLSRALTTKDAGPKTWADALKFDKTHKTYLSENDFIAMVAAYPHFLDFARQLQEKLQELSLGTSFYTMIMQRQEYVRTQEARARMMNESLLSSGLLLPVDETVSGKDRLPLPSTTDFGLGNDHVTEPNIMKRDNRNLLKLGYKLLSGVV